MKLEDVLGSQSLFHQVCVRSPYYDIYDGGVCRNPFFIRSVFVRRQDRKYSICSSVAIPFSSGLCSFHSAQSFLFHLVDQVAIPFSSGLCSFEIDPDLWERGGSQSLFHQVCVRSSSGRGSCTSSRMVAIPFSSGLCSFARSCQRACQARLRRNPFFIRSVFVPPLRAKGETRKEESQSLFHQVCVRSSPGKLRFPEPGTVAIPFSSGLCSFSTRTVT